MLERLFVAAAPGPGEFSWLVARAADARSQAAVGELETKVRDVATGSVRLELSGLFLVGVGSIIATLPAVFGWH